MNKDAALLEKILDHFGLTGDQRTASAARQVDVTVTAGAGSGKTRTLVARYIGLLSEGYAPRAVVAITFTEKAAREMRTRVRTELRRFSLAADPDMRSLWAEIEAQMDSARIGTIHSLCAEILRAHPAEAGLDPQFSVTEESDTVRLRAAAVEAALLFAAEQPEMRPLFAGISTGKLEQIITLLLAKRLEVTPESLDPSTGLAAVSSRLERFMLQDPVQAILADFLAAKNEGRLVADAGDRLAGQIIRLLGLMDEAVRALAERQPARCARVLWQARKSEMALNVGRQTSQCKDALKELRGLYEAQLDPWLGKEEPDEQADALLLTQMPLLSAVYAKALEAYQAALRERQAVDFDDLEAGALDLLRQPAVAAHWQARIEAVLVDEFQDTNHRQRELVQRLCGGESGRLFVVGDARQSIYRFRGADVTVFTNLQEQNRRRGGLVLDLDRTFRAHASLLDAAGGLLATVMGDQPDPERPFFVPFSPLDPQRKTPRAGCLTPYVECRLGVGENSESGRQAAARALAGRLREMHSSGEIRSWDEVTLLFRASSGFPFYEEAFESAGIPFVTVAGSGFYDRPEIRDLINSLRALSDPWDDQALAGFLRSPAIGLSDPGLYLLRYQDGKYQPLRRALEQAPSGLAELDQAAVQRAFAVLEEFELLVDRLPVAELLRRLAARMDTLAVLAAARSRLWRNASKLIRDARRSGLVRVRAFIEYIDALRDVGAREGEAISEAEGAVRLMTIHKSKGLEFPVVVLADANHGHPAGNTAAYPLALSGSNSGSCWAVAADRVSSPSLVYRLAKYLDGQQSDAESGRLLYVAMTRAQEKLLISGHITLKADGGWRCGGWLEELFDASGADVTRCLNEPGTVFSYPLPSGGQWALCLGSPDGDVPEPSASASTDWPASAARSLSAALAAAPPEIQAEQVKEELAWLPAPRQAPSIVVGSVVHEALRRWNFAVDGNGALDALLRQRARQEGIDDGDSLDEVVRISKILLARFQRHPLCREIQTAEERRLSIPFQGRDGTHYIDVLYRTPSGWKLLDFHTSSLQGEADARAVLEQRRQDLTLKCQAVQHRWGINPQVSICFLDVDHHILVVGLETD